jgi:hypothetical protein
MTYQIVTEKEKSSRGTRRNFNVDVAEGLTPDVIVEILKKRAAAGQAFLPGTLVGNSFEGEVAPLYSSHLSNDEAIAILTEQFSNSPVISFPADGFKITVGLKEGYGESGTLHSVDSISHLIPANATTREGVVCYAWPEGPGKAGGGHEEQVIIEGDGLNENEVNELAAELAARTGQTRVYVCFNAETWIIQAEGKETPTGETV